MPTAGPNLPNNARSTSSGDANEVTWQNPTNIELNDTSEATITAATFDSPDPSFYLQGDTFSFSIPAGSIIDGITVTVNRRSITANGGIDRELRLLDANGALIGDDKADTGTVWPGTLTDATYGGSTDTWNTGLSDANLLAMVNDAQFGVSLQAQANTGNADIAVEWISITITYSAGASTLTPVTSTETAQALNVDKHLSITPVTSTEVAGSIVAWQISAVTETDAAQALTITSGGESLSHATETDAAQALSVVKTLSIVSTTETDAAQALSVTKTIYKSLTAATETDAAQASVVDKSVTMVASTEADAAQALSVTHTHFRTLTAATESGAAQALDIDKYVSLGQNEIRTVTISDTVGPPVNSGNFTMTFRSQTTSGVDVTLNDGPTILAALEALSNIDPGDVEVTTLSLTGDEQTKFTLEFKGQYARQDIVTGDFTVNTGTMDDSSISVGNTQQGSSGSGLETDAAQTLSISQASSHTLTPATETDAAQASVVVKSVVLTAATETDASQALSVTKTIYKSLTPATETDAAQAADVDKSLALTAATETDAAQALSTSGPITLTPVTSTEVAGSIVAWEITSATETDAAQALSITAGSYTLTPVTETDVVAGLEALRITAATETDAAQALAIAAGEYSLTPATEADAAQALSFTKTIYKALTAATESDAAQALSFTKTIYKSLTAAVSTDAAQGLSLYRLRTLSPATEADAAQALVTAAHLALTPATEADAGQLLSRMKLVAISPATESDDAVPFSGFQPEGGGGRQRTLTGVGG